MIKQIAPETYSDVNNASVKLILLNKLTGKGE
jgi:hypothetical protein